MVGPNTDVSRKLGFPDVIMPGELFIILSFSNAIFHITLENQSNLSVQGSAHARINLIQLSCKNAIVTSKKIVTAVCLE